MSTWTWASGVTSSTGSIAFRNCDINGTSSTAGPYDWRVFAGQWAYNSGNYDRGPLPLRWPATWDGEIELPDGAKLVCRDGNYRIEDRDARVTYRANRNRAFNRYVNASDLMEEFIGFLGALGVTQVRFLDVPIEVFINWLIMRAAQQDGEDVPENVVVEQHPKLLLPSPRWAARCKGCGRFIGRQVAKLGFCSPEHARLAFAQAGKARPIGG